VAALCEVLVVVESRETGGSLITVLEATRRGIDVMAVPGSPRTRASNGTNQLLVDGAAPVTCVDDVLVALGLDHHRADPVRTPSVRHASEHDALDGWLLWLLEQQSSTLDMLAVAAERSVGEVAMAVMRLEQDGMVLDSEGWWEPVGSRLGNPPVRSAGSEIEPS
jgi:DNA processing protein